jgi:hypothetical protein
MQDKCNHAENFKIIFAGDDFVYSINKNLIKINYLYYNVSRKRPFLIQKNDKSMKLTILFLFSMVCTPLLTHAQKYQASGLINKFVCQDKAVSFILNNLKSDPNNAEFITAFIKEKEIENCKELFEVESEIDLNKDNIKEIILRAKNSPKGMFYCGATGNCSTWILSKSGNQYQIIFNAGSIEKVTVENQIAKGYRNLLIRSHAGAMNHFLGKARFDGKKYQIKECIEEITKTNGSSSIVRRNPSDCQ